MTRYKPIGWRNDNYRHSLAARGLTQRTALAHKKSPALTTMMAFGETAVKTMPMVVGMDLNAEDATATTKKYMRRSFKPIIAESEDDRYMLYSNKKGVHKIVDTDKDVVKKKAFEDRVIWQQKPGISAKKAEKEGLEVLESLESKKGARKHEAEEKDMIKNKPSISHLLHEVQEIKDELKALSKKQSRHY